MLKRHDTNLIDDFISLYLKPALDHLKKKNKEGKFCCLELMMGFSVGQIGALNKEIITERAKHASKLSIGDNNTYLVDPLIDKPVVLRLN